MRSPLIIFTHIPKTAGTTLKRIIRAQSTRSAALDINSLPKADWPRAIAELSDDVRIVMGNARYGLHQHTSRPCRYFTLLREPIDRAISSYYHILREPTHHLHAQYNAEQTDLVTSERRAANLQTKFIAGTASGIEVDAAEFARARQNLEQVFEVFGLVEQFDETLLFLVQAFGWAAEGYVRHNVNSARPAKSRVPAETVDALREVSSYDVQLYDFARQLFADRIARQPASFRDELDQLRRRAERMAGRQQLASRWRGFLSRLGLVRK